MSIAASLSYERAGTATPLTAPARNAVPAVRAVGAFVTISTPYKPIGAWIDGRVPVSYKYVPALRLDQVYDCVPPASVAAPNEFARSTGWSGGVNAAPPPVTGQEVPVTAGCGT